jgi:hypothetical protein
MCYWSVNDNHLKIESYIKFELLSGRLSGLEAGRAALDRHRALSLLMNLLSCRSDHYLKLVVSCLDYRSHLT